MLLSHFTFKNIVKLLTQNFKTLNMAFGKTNNYRFAVTGKKYELIILHCVLLQRHCLDNKQLASIVTKFFGFLSTFMSHDAVKASKMLHQYLPILK